MSTLRNIAVFVLVVSFLTFVAFFGRLPGLRNTPIGFLHRVLWIHIPKALSSLDHAVSGGRISASVSRTGRYLAYEKHPLVTILFLGLIAGSATLLLPQTWSAMSSIERLTITILLPQPFIFTYLAASVRLNPELHIHPGNLARQLSYYPYDYCLYHPGRECRTCRLPKPARSKHCSICKACVARSDHHCIWVNNCLGRGNYRWFLALLVSTSLLLFFGVHLARSFLAPKIESYRESHGTLQYGKSTASSSGLSVLAVPVAMRFYAAIDWLQIALIIGGLSVTGVGLLALFTAPLPLGLLAYHVYLIWAGTTTNESGKWSDWRDDMNAGAVWMGDIRPKRSTVSTNGSADGSQGAGRASQTTSWPTKSRYCLVETNDGHMPRPPLPPPLDEVVDQGSWRRAWRLAQVENVYDLGFWDNLAEVLK